MDKKTLIIVNIIAVVLLTISSVPSVGAYKMDAQLFSSTGEQLTLSDSSRGETELKYYSEEYPIQVISFDPGGLFLKTAIRLTQDEIGPYRNWIFTKVNVAVTIEECYLNGVDIQIFIYDKGTPIRPGPLITNQTTAHIDTTGITTIPLVTSINLSDYEEIWVAVEWQTFTHSTIFAFIDTLSGPHVENKSDFVGFNGGWTQLHHIAPWLDGRWIIGAIVEGSGVTELSVGNIKGPVGITADVSNIGGLDVAKNVTWSIRVTGGLFHKVTVLKNGTVASLAVNSSIGIDTGMFFGFGKIDIMITAKAENALEVTKTKTAFLIGPFVVGIK